jgi:putative membrane protein
MKALALSTLIAVLAGNGCAHSERRMSDPADALSDSALLAIYTQVNEFDVQTAAVGLERAQSEAVRALAQMVHDDHGAVLARTAELARSLHVEPELPAERAVEQQKHEAVLASLRAVSDNEFDRAYLTHEIAFHSAAIDAVKTVLIPQASPKVQELLEAVLPGFEHHLAETKRVAQALQADAT